MNSISSSVHLVDPELRDFINLWPIQTLTETTLADARSITGEMAESLSGLAAQQLVQEERYIEGDAPDQPPIRALVHRPDSDLSTQRPGLFYVHGGGYVMGAPELNSMRAISVVNSRGCVMLSPAHRLAPETKFPGPLDDLYTSLKWFYEQSDALGVDRQKIVIAGESAGGGLVAALAMLVRDRGEIPLAGQILIYPMLDDRTATIGEPRRFVGEFIWTPAMNQFSWEGYLPWRPGSDDVVPYAAAARAQDFSGLPPAFIFSGALDLFLEENLEYVRQLSQAGVGVGLHVYPGAYHCFDLAGDTKVGRQFSSELDAALAALFDQSVGR